VLLTAPISSDEGAWVILQKVRDPPAESLHESGDAAPQDRDNCVRWQTAVLGATILGFMEP